MNFASLAEWLSWQETLHPSEMELGLDRVKRVAERLDFYPALLSAEKKFHTVIVGGTNGKGSCVAYLESILIAAGYRVGAYSSPHLLKYNERVRINGVMVDDQRLCDSFTRIDAARKQGAEPVSLTYFEFGTLAAMDLFYQHPVDIQILEVGLGGRLDAVNIIDADVAVVVNVAMDHEAWLGNTRELIGAEKAGIFRAGIPLIIGEASPPESLLAAAQALDRERVRVAGKDFSLSVRGDSWEFTGRDSQQRTHHWTGLPQGRLPLPSAACALQVLAEMEWAPIASIKEGLKLAHLPGRCQMLNWQDRRILLDVAHNPAGAAYLADWLLQHQISPVRTVFSALADKDYEAAMSCLKPHTLQWYLAPLPVARGESLQNLLQAAAGMQVPLRGFDTIAAALRGAVEDSRPGDVILVCGSFYSVAEAMGCLSSGGS